ncbi:uncharacterized protein [Palaemon carinicauda]|uniref:uncharacterized protein n=1 Tax=Palaemon carinicauda TaxID=392227 RepID=UPI0035B63DB5
MRKGSEWWNEKVKITVEEKKRAFEEWLQSNSVEKYKRYREKNVEVKLKICGKYLAKSKEVYVAFMDLEKAYNSVDREGMWNVMMLYGIGGRLLQAVKSFYKDSKACVRIVN